MSIRSDPHPVAVPASLADASPIKQPGLGRDLPAHLAFLRDKMRPGPAYAGVLPFGDARVDGCFPPQSGQAGLPLGALHEIGAEGRGAETGELPAAFAAVLLAGICESLRGIAPVLWAATVPDLYPPGLPGLDPARLVLVNPRDEAGVLAALEIALRAGGLSPAGLCLPEARCHGLRAAPLAAWQSRAGSPGQRRRDALAAGPSAPRALARGTDTCARRTERIMVDGG